MPKFESEKIMPKIEISLPELDADEVKALPVTSGDAGHKFHHQQIDMTLPDGTRVRGNVNLWALTADDQIFKSTVVAKFPKEHRKFEASKYIKGTHFGQPDAEGVTRYPPGMAKGAKG